MKIADIKKKYFEKIEQLNDSRMENVNVGNKYFELKFGMPTLMSRKEECLVEGHLVISLTVIRSYSGDLKIGSDKVFAIFKEYWREYAEAKKMAGVLFVQPSYSTSHAGKGPHKECEGKGNATDSELKFLDKAVGLEKANGVESVYEAYISTELKEKINRYFKVRETIKSVMEKSPLFIQVEGHADWPLLLNRNSDFDFIGEKMQINTSLDFSEFHIVTGKKKEEITIEATEKELLLFLEGVKERTAFVKELTPPMTHYLSGVNRLCSYASSKDTCKSREFEKLCEKLGGWEVVEKQFVELNKQLDMMVFDVNEKNSKQEINVYEKSTPEYIYHFVNYRRAAFEFEGNEVEREFYILVSSDSTKKELKKWLSEKLYANL